MRRAAPGYAVLGLTTVLAAYGVFLALESPDHNAVYQIPTDDTWGPILELLR